jgi:CO/xanthine dehydrogenase FAD-binding subunit
MRGASHPLPYSVASQGKIGNWILQSCCRGKGCPVQMSPIRIEITDNSLAGAYRHRALQIGALPAGGFHLYVRPKSLNEAVQVLADCGGRILAGGTDFFPALGENVVPDPVIDLSGLNEFRGIAVTTDEVRIGGLTTWTDVIRAPLPRCFQALKEAAKEVGSVQIQNRGTVAGNLCNASPAADGVPPLMALDAEVELVSLAGTRRIPLASFIVGNRKTLRRSDEILTQVIVPRVCDNAASVFLKLGARRYLVISIAMVAAIIDVGRDGRVATARVAVGSCSVVAQRLRALEADLVGKPARTGLDLNATARHLEPLAPIDDVRATAAYRNDAALTLVRRALDRCVEVIG